MADSTKKAQERRKTEDKFREEEMSWKLKELEEGGEYVVGGETTIEYEVIGAVAATAAREVNGVSSVGSSSIRRTLSETFGSGHKRARGAKVEAGKKEAIIDLEVKITYGFSIPQLVIDIRKKVGARLLDMFGLVAKEVNVNILGIDFPERAPGKVQ
jgi:uncharacterized alkaline shock family protein YloU